MNLKKYLKNILFYGGISEEAYERVRGPVAESNRRLLMYTAGLVSLFWLYCLLMSLKDPAYTLCREAYAAALVISIASFLYPRCLEKLLPRLLPVVIQVFKLSLVGAGVWIAVCQWDVRTITMFTTAIIVPSIFIDRLITSVVIDILALLAYIIFGRGIIVPEIFTWGLGNFIIFAVSGLLVGTAIYRDRFERFVFADSASLLAEIQTRHAFYDQLTDLQNRRAYEEKLRMLAGELPRDCCVVNIDIDGLKEMNDTNGHEAGDELIIGAAECLCAAFPDTEDVYRVGGDEFCVIVTAPEEDVKQSLTELERIIAQREGRYVHGISLSFGMASAREFDDVDAIVKAADARMYEMKSDYYARTGKERRR